MLSVTMVKIQLGPMETVREVEQDSDEWESVDVSSTWITRPRIRFMGRCFRLNPLRSWWAGLLVVLLAATMVVVVGVVVYRNTLDNKQQELRLKCQNRKEVLKSELDNNLGASFVILGLVTSISDVDQSTWLAFTDQTLFLRPHVRSMMYCRRVLGNQRAVFEMQNNGSMYTFVNSTRVLRGDAEEYAPIVLRSANITTRLMDLYGYDILRFAVMQARDTGNFSLSPPYMVRGVWRMASFLPHYGNLDPATLTTSGVRRKNCIGYVVTILNVQEVFGSFVSRFKDEELEINAIAKVDPALNLNLFYNCTEDAKPCEVLLFGNNSESRNSEGVDVEFLYGGQHIELRCWYLKNLHTRVLREIIAWPLLMLAVVVFCIVSVYLVLKRMSTAEEDVNEREKINVKLREAKVKAEAADTAKSSFLATVSHEIRTPMNGVIGMTNLLIGTDLTPQQLEYVKIAQASGNALVSLISDVLDLSKIEAGRIEIETVPFDVREEVDNILSIFEERVHQKKLEISALVHDSVPQILHGDPGRLRQVLINLVGNSIKFTKQGSIFLCVRIVDPQFYDIVPPPASQQCLEVLDATQKFNFEPEFVDSQHDGRPDSIKGVIAVRSNLFRMRYPHMVPPKLSMKSGDPGSTSAAVDQWRNWKPLADLDVDEVTLVISIEDTGIGIPKYMQTRLFQPFVQADSSTSREYGGTGIGLSICQKLVRLRNGDIIAESEEGQGSIFKFSLVLPTPKQRGELMRQAHPTKFTSSGLGEEGVIDIRVLLLDANPVRQEVAATYLRRVRSRVEYADCVDTALRLLKSGIGPSVQAVIVDLQGVDHESSIQLVHRLKASFTKNIPLLALSIPTDRSLQSKLQEAGYSHIVHKPLRRTTFVSGLLQTLGLQTTSPSRRPNTDADMLAGKRLLVVDDNMVNRRVASSMLQRYGATVVTVDGGKQAIAAVKKQEPDKPIHMILMDIQMPEMDGYEATRYIRRWEAERFEACRALGKAECFTELKECAPKRIPIVAVTADVMKGTHEMCIRAGMDDYIPKPLDQKQLRLLLERFLNNRLVNTPGSSASNAQLSSESFQE